MERWERSEALNLLSGFLRDGANRGRVALVAGEAGIGNLRLVNKFARRCGPRMRVLWGARDRLVLLSTNTLERLDVASRLHCPVEALTACDNPALRMVERHAVAEARRHSRESARLPGRFRLGRAGHNMLTRAGALLASLAHAELQSERCRRGLRLSTALSH